MGIIYYVAFRFGAVKDIAKIDEEVDYYDNHFHLRYTNTRKCRCDMY